MADHCDPIRKMVDDLKTQLRGIPPFVPNDEGHPERNPDYIEVQKELTAAQRQLAACEGSTPPPPPSTPVPLKVVMMGLISHGQNDTFGDDEPYILAYAVDAAVSLNLAPPGASLPLFNSKTTLIGPLDDVDDDGAFHSAPTNIIWGLESAPAMITGADNLIILVSVIENDDGGPEVVRAAHEAAAKLKTYSEWPALATGQINRDEYVRRIAEEIVGAIVPATTGVPNPDDIIGPTQELRFYQTDLDSIYQNPAVTIDRTLRFVGDDADYLVQFRLSR